MGVEIERRFLVTNTSWQGQGQAEYIRQGYLSDNDSCTVRVRLRQDTATLTIKGRTHGLSREEFEYSIPLAEGEALLTLAGTRIIEKWRHTLIHKGHTWEVDVFAGYNTGLTLAEIELTAEDEHFIRPHWLGPEVSHERRYTNAALAQWPYTHWSNA